MTASQKLQHLEETITACRAGCAARGEPFHADALAAALGVSYETLLARADGKNTTAAVAARLKAALQECTASVVAAALAADPKAHGLWMFYLRNRAGFADKGEHPTTPAAVGGVIFVGEERI